MAPQRTRLYLATPEKIEDAQLLLVFSAAVAAGDVASILVRASTVEEKTARARLLAPVAHDHDIAILIDEDSACVAAAGADGVHVSGGVGEFTKAREVVGSEMIVGVNAGSSKHAAMEAAEAGADFISFEDNELALWWAQLFEVPCVALGPDEKTAGDLAAAGVEFICPGETMWREPEAAAQTVQQYCEICAGIENA